MSQTHAGRKALWTVVACALLLAIAGTSAAGESVAAGGKGLPEKPPTAGDIIPDRYIVTLKPGASAKAVTARHGFKPAVSYEKVLNGFVAELPSRAVNRLRADRDVLGVVPDRIVSVAQVPDCPTQTLPNPAQQCLPAGVDRIDADLNTVAKIDGIDDPMDVDIAILDTGIQTNHPDLRVVGGARFVGPDCTGTSYEDDFGHGTHVAGIVAAKDNGVGTVGVAPGARLWAVKVLGSTGSGPLSCVIAGIDWVTAHADTIEVANLSLGSSGPGPGSDPVCAAITASAAAGVVYSVAVGNSRIDAGTFAPAYCPDVLTVSAITDNNGAEGGGAPPPSPALCNKQYVDDTFAEFSNFGATVEIAAPGVCIYSTWIGGSYKFLSGTSMAAPHVAGAAALDVLVYGKPIDGAGSAAVRDRLVANGAPQGGPKGFSGDPDAYPEPLLYVAALADHDAVAGSVSLPRPVVPDTSVPVTAQVLNNGTNAESLTVRLTSSGGTVTGSPQTVNLASGGLAAVAFTWNTAGLAPGNYTLTSSVDAVAGETNLTNNSRNASVEVRTPEHDVAVSDVNLPSDASIVAAGTTMVSVAVSNTGTSPETFSVSLVSTAGTVLDSPKSVNLPAEGSSTITFTWDTSSVAPGAYSLTGAASQVPGETDLSDNASTVPVTVSRATISVNSTTDPGDGVCAGSECTLREAITEANGAIGMNYIQFSVPSTTDPGCDALTGVCTITPASKLPDITDGVNIDGYSQPGAAANTNSVGSGVNASLRIELNGANLPLESAVGLTTANTTTSKSKGSTIRGLVINRFLGNGIYLRGEGGNVVEGSFIGTNAAGTASLANGVGVYVESEYNVVGGTSPAARNVISGNTSVGLFIFGDAGTSNLVQGNLIGTSATGITAVGNGNGVKVFLGTNNTIGGTSTAARNIISGNQSSNPGAGVYISIARGNTVQGNFVGLDVGGTQPLGNSGAGVWLNINAINNVIGGTASGASNTVAHNYSGVVISGGYSVGNVVRGNSIHSNSYLGIDLSGIAAWPPGGPGGVVNPNDSGDVDEGANNYQNFPVLTSAWPNFNATVIAGTLNSLASTTFTLDLYSSPACDGSGYGEGQTFRASSPVTTDSSGNVSFSLALPPDLVPHLSWISATATDPAGNTSEFSFCVQAVDPDIDNDGVYDADELACGVAPANLLTRRPERTDGVFAGVDDDGDTQIDEALPPGSETHDCDGDGFSGAIESYVTSSSSVRDQDPCGEPRQTNFNPQYSLSFPGDINTSGGSYNKVDVMDTISFLVPVRRLDTSVGHPNYHARWDLNMDGSINSYDVNLLPAMRPPIFGGYTAYNRPCPSPP